MLTSHSDSTLQRRHTHEPVDGLGYECPACMMRHCKLCFNNISDSCHEVPIDNNRRPHASHLRDQSVQAYCGEHDAEIFWGIDNRKNRCETMLLSALCHNNGPACGMSSQATALEYLRHIAQSHNRRRTWKKKNRMLRNTSR